MPTLKVEDGSQVSGANTYATLAEYDSFISDRGYSDSRTEDQKNASLIAATDYVEGLEGKFDGSRVSSAQPLSFPRQGVYLNGFLLGSSEIPDQLKKGQMQLSFDSIANELYSVGDGLVLTRKKTDVLERSYANGGSSNPQNVFTAAVSYLRPLYRNGGSLASVKV